MTSNPDSESSSIRTSWASSTVETRVKTPILLTAPFVHMYHDNEWVENRINRSLQLCDELDQIYFREGTLIIFK